MPARSIAPFALLALAAAPLPAQEPVLLRLGGTVGRTEHHRVVVTAFVSAAGAGESLGALTRVASYRTLTLDSVHGDTLTFTVRVDSTRLEGPAEPEVAAMLEAAAARGPSTLTVRMDARGRMLRAASGAGSGAAPLPGSPGGLTDVGPGLLLPAGPVRPGDTWIDTIPLPLPEEAGGPTRMRVESRLERVDARGTAGTAVVSARARIPLSIGGSQVDIPFAAVYDLDVAERRVTGSAAVSAVRMRTVTGDVTTRSEMSEAGLGTDPPPVPALGEPGTVDLTSLAAPAFSAARAGAAPQADSAEPVGVELSPAPARFTVVRLGTPAEGPLNALLAEHVRRARSAGRRPIAEFDAAWCGPCQSLRRSLGDDRMVEAFAGTYVVKVDLDGWQAHLAGTGFEVQAIPVFFELGDDGRPTGRRIDGGAWGEDIPANMAPPLKAFFRPVSGARR